MYVRAWWLGATCCCLGACISIAEGVGGNSDFSAVLDNVNVALPLSRFNIELPGLGTATISIDDLVCSNITLADIELDTVSAVEAKKLGLPLTRSVDGLQMYYKYVKANVGSLDLTCYSPLISIVFKNQLFSAKIDGVKVRAVASLEMYLEVSSRNWIADPPSNPRVLRDRCMTHLSLQAVSIEVKSKLDQLLNSIAQMLAKELKDQDVWFGTLDMGRILCEELGNLVEKELGSVMTELEASIRDFQSLAALKDDPLENEKSHKSMPEWTNFETDWVFSTVFNALNSEFTTSRAENLDPLTNLTLRGPTNNSASAFIRDVTNSTGEYHFDTSNITLFSSEGFGLRMETLTLKGLDSIISFDPVETFGKYTFGTNVSFGDLRLEAEMLIKLDVLGHFHGQGLRLTDERFRVSLGLLDTELSLAMCLGIGAQKGWDLQFGSVLQKPLECFLTTVEHINVTRSIANIPEFSQVPDARGFVNPTINVTDLVNPTISKLVHTAIGIVIDLYGPSGLPALPGYLTAHGRDMITESVRNFIHDEKECPEARKFSDEPFFNFQTDDMFQSLVQMINRDVTPNINSKFITDMTMENSGEKGVYYLMKDRDYGQLMFPMGLFEVGARDVHVTGLDSFHDVQFMNATDAYVLHNEFKLGGALHGAHWLESSPEGIQGTAQVALLPPVTFSMILEMNFTGTTITDTFRNEFELSFTFEDFLIAVDFTAQVNRFSFEQLEIEQLFNLDCILARISHAALAPTKPQVAFKRLGVNLKCLNCTSSAMHTMEDLVNDPKNNRQFTDTVNRWLATIIRKFEEKLSPDELERNMRMMEAKCSGSYRAIAPKAYKHVNHSSVNALGVIGGVLFAMFMGLLVGCLVRSKSPYTIKRRTPPLHVRVRSSLRVLTKRFSSQSKVPDPVEDESADQENSGDSSTWTQRFHRFSTSSDSADIVFDRDQVDMGLPTYEEATDEQLQECFKRVPLFLHPAIPFKVRWGIMLMFMNNLFLFFLGHWVICANVNVIFSVLGDDLLMTDFAGFSIPKSIQSMWDAGIYPLAILVGALSGAWPYIKVITMLVCWVLPPSLMSAEKRGKYLLNLDMLGKWSMIDVYVLFLIMVSFGIKIRNPSLSVLPDGFYGVQCIVDPQLGLFSFTLAAMLSLFANNLCLHYHRNAVAAENQLDDTIAKNSTPRLGMTHTTIQARNNRQVSGDGPHLALSNVQATGDDHNSMANPNGNVFHHRRRFSSWMEKAPEDLVPQRTSLGSESQQDEVMKSDSHDSEEALKDHVFQLPNGEKLQMTVSGHNVIITALITSGLLVIVGCSIRVFEFSYLGLVGMLMDVDGQGNDVIPMSVFDIFRFVWDQAVQSTTGSIGYKVGTTFLAFSFLLTAFFMPLLQLAALTNLFVRKCSLAKQKWYFFLAEVLSAWACIDVLIVSLIIGVLELGEIGAAMLSPVCSSIMPMVNEVLVPVGFVTEEDRTCLAINSSLEAGAALLLTAALLSNALFNLIIRLGHRALEDRENHPSHKHSSADTGQASCFLRGLVFLGLKLGCVVKCEHGEDIAARITYLDNSPMASPKRSDQLALAIRMD